MYKSSSGLSWVVRHGHVPDQAESHLMLLWLHDTLHRRSPVCAAVCLCNLPCDRMTCSDTAPSVLLVVEPGPSESLMTKGCSCFCSETQYTQCNDGLSKIGVYLFYINQVQREVARAWGPPLLLSAFPSRRELHACSTRYWHPCFGQRMGERSKKESTT